MKKLLILIIISSVTTVSAQQTLTKEFYEDRQILRELIRIEGTDTVHEKIYHQNGQLNFLYKMVDNQRAGNALTYDQNGNLLFKQNYESGRLDGISKAFYASGETSRTEIYKNGFHVDTSVYFNQIGSVTKKVIYKEPCEFASKDCNLKVIIFQESKPVYSYEVNQGLKSTEHEIINEELYSKLMASESKISLVDKGKIVFRTNCSMCHRLDKPFIGPALECITDRKEETEIKKIIEGMDNHPISKLTEEEYKSLIEYLKTNCP